MSHQSRRSTRLFSIATAWLLAAAGLSWLPLDPEDPASPMVLALLFSVAADDPQTDTCFGDGSGSACPCANESESGHGQSCRNSGGSGAKLWALGSSSVAADDLTFAGSGLLPDHPGLSRQVPT